MQVMQGSADKVRHAEEIPRSQYITASVHEELKE